MGPVEITFLSIAVIFAVVGVVRGHGRELGVTIMLLLTLLVIEFIEAMAGDQLNSLITAVLGNASTQRETVKALMWCGALIVVTMISYHGETFSFSSDSRNGALSLGVGLLNGYLFAGSLWYYLGRAGWPYLHVSQPYSALYQFVWRWLPPNLLDWPYLLALVTVMLVLRVWK